MELKASLVEEKRVEASLGRLLQVARLLSCLVRAAFHAVLALSAVPAVLAMLSSRLLRCHALLSLTSSTAPQCCAVHGHALRRHMRPATHSQCC